MNDPVEIVCLVKALQNIDKTGTVITHVKLKVLFCLLPSDIYALLGIKFYRNGSFQSPNLQYWGEEEKKRERGLPIYVNPEDVNPELMLTETGEEQGKQKKQKHVLPT